MSKSSSHKSSNYGKDVLAVICPKCGRFSGKKCKKTSGSDKGKDRNTPHSERVAMTKVKVSKRVVEKVHEASKHSEKKETKKSKEKITPEQQKVIDTIIDKVAALSNGKQIEYAGPVTVGPYITTYRFKPNRKLKVKTFESFGADLAVALGAESTLVKMMPGESSVGVFVPHKENQRKKIELKDTLEHVMDYMSQKTEDGHKPIPLNFGMDHNGNPFVDDLTNQPHLLMAGTTNSGKSTSLRAIVLSMLFSMSSDELKLIISDTKGVEFNAFAHVPHILQTANGSGYCNSVYSTMAMLEWAVKQTQQRYDLLRMENVQNIHQYNAKVVKDKRVPFVVIVIDELADLVALDMGRSEAKANAEKLKTIAARSRAAGIYLLASTQRPDVNTVKGSIKANFPGRASFRLPSNRDSITILGVTGAQHLISKGDMLYISTTNPVLKRLHAPWTSIDDVTDLIKNIIQREQLKFGNIQTISA